MKIHLRDYQEEEINLVRNAFIKGHKRVMSVLPPGAGKGTLIAKHAVDAVMKGKRVLIFMHKRELAIQQAERIVKQFGFRDVGFIISGLPKAQKPIMIGTVQTMTRRNIYQGFDLIIVDECHRIKTNQHQSIMEMFPDRWVIGYTATPFRSDKKGFKDDFDVLIQCTNYNKMVKQKYLVATRVVEPDVPLDFTGIKLRSNGGEKDFNNDELLERFDDDKVYRQVVEKWLQWGKGKKTIVFTVNSKIHCRKTAEYFQKYNIDARPIDSDTTPEERNRLFESFKKGDYPVLCNIGLFTEGISIDDTDCIVFNVATQSPTKWVQAAARGSRPVWNSDYSDWLSKDGEYIKTHCLIIDFGGNRERHGKVDDYDIFPFDLSGTPPKKGEAKTKDCPACGEVVFVQTRTCPKCGYQFPIKPKEDGQVFADEVDWKVVDRVKALVDKVSSERLPHDQLKRWLESSPMGHLLRLIAKVRGYGENWSYYTAIRYGYTDKKIEEKDAILEQLRAFEKENGIFEAVEQIDQIL